MATDHRSLANGQRLTDGRSDLFVPYFEYEHTLDYLPLFSVRENALSDFAFGFSSGIGFARDWEVISYSRANRPGTSSIKLDVKGGRRFADSYELERLFFDLSVDFEYTLSKQWTVALTPAFKARRYDNYFATYGATIGLAWS